MFLINNDVINIINDNIITIISVLLIIITIVVLTRINLMISLFNLIIFYILLGPRVTPLLRGYLGDEGLLLYVLNLNVLGPKFPPIIGGNLVIIGLLYILIYVGAISVLFIFILSLINIKNSELYYKSYSLDLILILYTIIILSFIYYNLLDFKWEYGEGLLFINNLDLLSISFNIREFKVIGELLYTDYSILFLILGLILLLSIISAILLIFRTKTN